MSGEHKILKGIVKGFFFLTAFICVGMVLNDILRHKWNYSEDSAAQQIVQGYYEEPEETIDVLLLGASTVRNGFSPLEMYHSYGFTSYSRATSIQTPVISYYLLQETLENHDIKAVVMDVTALAAGFSDIDGIDGKMHEAIDYMPQSKYKFELIRDLTDVENMSFVEFMVPLYTYHDRWSDLSEQDFTYRQWGNDYKYKGQYPALNVRSYTFEEDYMNREMGVIDESYAIDKTAEEYFNKMIDLCKKKGITFVMIKTPAASWDWNKHDRIQEIADKNKVPFVDFCDPELRSEIAFDSKTDFSDVGKHTNIWGAQKMSRYLGNYLTKICNLPDKRGNNTYTGWDNAYDIYQHLLTDMELSREKDLIKFLENLDEERFLIMISTRNDTSKYFTEDLKQAFLARGITQDFKDISFLSYLAVIDAGKLVYEDSEYSAPISYSGMVGGHDIEMVSAAAALSGNSSSIIVDGKEYSPNGYGFNFVIYDKVVDMVVAKASFNTGKDGKEYSASEEFTFGSKSNPVEYLESLLDSPYLTVIAACEDATEYIPGTVNEQLKKMGLLGLEGKKRCPYIAILDGDTVIYNKMGAKETILSANVEVEGEKISVISSTIAKSSLCRVEIGDQEFSYRKKGLCVLSFDKAQGELVNKVTFDWEKAYTSPVSFSYIEDMQEYLELAQQLEYDTICMYAPSEESEGAEALENDSELLRKEGFLGFEKQNAYIGVKIGSRLLYEASDAVTEEMSMQYSYKAERNTLDMTVEGNKKALYIGGTQYFTNKSGLYIIIYDPVNDAVLAAKRF